MKFRRKGSLQQAGRSDFNILSIGQNKAILKRLQNLYIQIIM